jgi:hypothetical protein
MVSALNFDKVRKLSNIYQRLYVDYFVYGFEPQMTLQIYIIPLLSTFGVEFDQ